MPHKMKPETMTDEYSSPPPDLAPYLVQHPKVITVVWAHTPDDALKLAFEHSYYQRSADFATDSFNNFCMMSHTYEIQRPDNPVALITIRR